MKVPLIALAMPLAGAPVWQVLAGREQAAAVSVGAGLVANVEGMYLIPPTYALGAAVLSPTGTSALYGVGFTYARVELDFD